MLTKKAKKWKGGVGIDKKRLIVFFWMIFCVLFAGYLLFCNIRIFEKRQDLSKSINEIDSSIKSLTKDKETLSLDLGQANDPSYVEKVAREDLGMQKSGEQVVVIKKSDNTASDTGDNKNNTWDSVINWFKSIKDKIMPE